MNTFGAEHPYTCLVIKNNGDIDPDDAFSRIPYEKGFSLLWYLQTIFGVEKFEAFLKGNSRCQIFFLKVRDFLGIGISGERFLCFSGSKNTYFYC